MGSAGLNTYSGRTQAQERDAFQDIDRVSDLLLWVSTPRVAVWLPPRLEFQLSLDRSAFVHETDRSWD